MGDVEPQDFEFDVIITDGREFERTDYSGNILPLSMRQIARAAFKGEAGQWVVPIPQWIIEFKGQITNGRHGRLAIRYGPLSWLPTSEQDEVKALISMDQANERAKP